MIMKMAQHRQAPSPYVKDEQHGDAVSTKVVTFSSYSGLMLHVHGLGLGHALGLGLVSCYLLSCRTMADAPSSKLDFLCSSRYHQTGIDDHVLTIQGWALPSGFRAEGCLHGRRDGCILFQPQV